MISLIIPNYNKSRFIEQTLNSVLEQTHSKWEAIIIDDSSTDESVEVINSFVERDARIKLLRNKENRGGSICRNWGLEVACGEYVIFLDSDDLLAPTCLEYRVQRFLKNCHCDFIVFPMTTFLSAAKEHVSSWCPKSRENHLLSFLKHDLPWSIMQPIWKKSFLNKLGGFDERYPRLQDVELHTRALMDPQVRYHVVDQAKPDCYYRICSERTEIDYYQAAINQVDGTCLYLHDINWLIRQSRDDCGRRLMALKGTWITMVNHLLYLCKTTKITAEFRDSLLERVAQTMSEAELLRARDSFLQQVYMRGFNMNCYKVKGYNRMFKFLICT